MQRTWSQEQSVSAAAWCCPLHVICSLLSVRTS